MIYLDSAATTLQKPPSVAAASARAINYLSSPGRGGHTAATAAAETAFQCREEAASFFHVPDPEQVVFTFNATHGLNIAVKSLVKPGSRVVISGYEHNAVTRPLHAIPNVTIKTARAPLFDPSAMADAFSEALDSGAEAAICTHVSNVFGTVLPISKISELCHTHEVPLIIDASQSAGILPLDFSSLTPAFMAMPGHKGLYGPQGTGLLLCGQLPHPLLEGGTGSESLRQEMPMFLPDRLEAGTHNMPGIAGLLEGLRFLRLKGLNRIQQHEQKLIKIMANGLSQLPALEVFYSPSSKLQTGVLSFYVKDKDCEAIAAQLSARGFALRSGLHCAPLAHETAGTLNTGTIRASTSIFNTEIEIRQFLKTMKQIIAIP